MSPLAKATDEGRQRAPLQSSRFLSEMPSLLRCGTLILYGIVVKCFDRLSITVFIYNLRRRRPSWVCQRTHPAPVRFYPRRHLRSGLVSPIQGAPNSVTTSLSCRLYLPRLKLNPKKVLTLSFGFDVDVFRHVVLQPKGGM